MERKILTLVEKDTKVKKKPRKEKVYSWEVDKYSLYRDFYIGNKKLKDLAKKYGPSHSTLSHLLKIREIKDNYGGKRVKLALATIVEAIKFHSKYGDQYSEDCEIYKMAEEAVDLVLQVFVEDAEWLINEYLEAKMPPSLNIRVRINLDVRGELGYEVKFIKKNK